MSILAAIQSTTVNITSTVTSVTPPVAVATKVDNQAASTTQQWPKDPAPAAETQVPKRITMWNKRENRKISGNAAPMEKNIDEYLRKHPECEVYNGQRSQMDPALRAAQLAAEPRVTIWNKSERRKVSGNAAPLEKNIAEYLRKHPDCEVYGGQDKRVASSLPQAAVVASVPQPPQIPKEAISVPVVQAKKLYMSPKCTLDFLAMVACQENLNLLNADDYETDADDCDHEELVEAKPCVAILGKRQFESDNLSAIGQLVKRVKAAA